MRCPRLLLIVVFFLSIVPNTLHAAPSHDSVRLDWHESEQLPLVEYGTALLPMRLVPLRILGANNTPQIERVTAARSTERLTQATNPPPNAGNQLPPAPVFVLAQGIQRGEQIVVVAISPIYGQDGVAMRASNIAASFDNAEPLGTPRSIVAQGTNGISLPPENAAARQTSAKIVVGQPGIQQLSGAGLPALPLGQLRLTRNGIEIPLEIADADGNGQLSAVDTLRFYAATVGDRWNATSTYWLASGGSGSPLRIASRSVSAGTGTARTTAVERGIWRVPRVYNSRVAGPDGDHWFAAELKSFREYPDTLTLDASAAPLLPRIDGDANYTVNGSIGKRSASTGHALDIATPTASTRLTWSGTGNFAQTSRLAQNGTAIRLTTVNGASVDELLVDSISWELPVQLQFSGNGATFATPTTGRYQVQNAPTPLEIYDITNSDAPQRLLTGGTTFQGEAGSSYLVLGNQTRATPTTTAFSPADLNAALAAQVVYVAPSDMQAALGPLVALRQSQGYQVALVDPQPIYDRWGYGQVSPEAIRSFFRAAYVGSGGSLKAAVLVGDGTNDPFDYTRKPGDEASYNVNIIPPYLADVDPFINETACDTCYSQLDGDSPLADTLPDIAIGRFPAKTAGQVADVVAKIVRYETGTLSPDSASRMLFVTDNYNLPNGQGGPATDSSGNFYQFAEDDIARQPAGVRIERMFFDPLAVPNGPDREPDPRTAYNRTKVLLNRGAAVVNYIGHGNFYQWAVTNLDGDPNSSTKGPGYLLGLYDPDGLTNGKNLPIMLEMTCLTSSFQAPANVFSTSIDERLVLKPDGGAIATWGSSGEGVVFGHNSLQRGFYTRLWANPGQQPTLGELTQSGYVELLTSEPVAQASMRTFLLLGDPLTRARVIRGNHIFTPLTRK